MARRHDDASTQALAVALQHHPAATADLHSACSLAQTCKGWRAAMQQAEAGTIDITFNKFTTSSTSGLQHRELARLGAFAAWLPTHAGLVQSLTISERWETPDITPYRALAEPLLASTLQLAAHPPAAAAGAAAQLVPRPPLRLQSYSSNVLNSPAILAALPAASLTHLDLSFRDGWALPPSGAFTAALGGLTNLQLVELEGGARDTLLPSAYMRGLAKLTRLTEVVAHDEVHSCSLTSLRQLQQLDIHESEASAEQLRELAGLPQMTRLCLCYRMEVDAAVCAAAAWRQLPQLRCLMIDVGEASQDQLTAILQGIAAATSLTDLSLSFMCCRRRNVALCQPLARLTQLQQLRVFAAYSTLEPGNAMHLTSLKQLTKLELVDCGAAVGDTVAVALASELSQLQRLNLKNCELSSTAALPAIARLSRLTFLDLVGNPGFTDAGIMLLTRLTQLAACPRSLQQHEQQPSAEAFERFWAAVRGVQQGQHQPQ